MRCLEASEYGCSSAFATGLGASDRNCTRVSPLPLGSKAAYEIILSFERILQEHVEASPLSLSNANRDSWAAHPLRASTRAIMIFPSSSGITRQSKGSEDHWISFKSATENSAQSLSAKLKPNTIGQQTAN